MEKIILIENLQLLVSCLNREGRITVRDKYTDADGDAYCIVDIQGVFNEERYNQRRIIGGSKKYREVGEMPNSGEFVAIWSYNEKVWCLKIKHCGEYLSYWNSQTEKWVSDLHGGLAVSRDTSCQIRYFVHR